MLPNIVTENGFDIQAATELSLSQAGWEGPTPPSPIVAEMPTETETGIKWPIRHQLALTSPNPSQTHPQSQPPLNMIVGKIFIPDKRDWSWHANALWKEGKERAVKMYEERAAAANTANGVPASDCRL